MLVLVSLCRCLLLLPLWSALNAAGATWYSKADHYWPMRDISNREVVNDKNGAWKGRVKGAQVTWNPPQLGLRLNGKDDWVDLGTRFNTCYVDVAHCSNGLTVALWVNIREKDRPQGLLTFGGKDCGVTLVYSGNEQLSVNIRSSMMRKAWELTSVRNRTLPAGTWNHVAVTWTGGSDGTSIYINGSRLDAVNTTFTDYSNASSDCSARNDSCHPPSPIPCEWTMAVGRMTAAESDATAHVYSAIDLAHLVLWSKVINILDASKHVSGIYPSNSGCLTDWLSNLQFCYDIVKTNKTWSDAHKSCAAIQAKLVSIGSEEEDEFLEQALEAQGVSSCVHLGVNANEGNRLSWLDGNIWAFSRLKDNQSSHAGQSSHATGQCVGRATDGSWRYINCSQQCAYICKRHRGRSFRDAEFYCSVKRRDYRFTQHRVMIRSVTSELECALECLIYGNGCYSYNYRYIRDFPGKLHICELNRSSCSRSSTQFLVPMDGYQYCARI